MATESNHPKSRNVFGWILFPYILLLFSGCLSGHLVSQDSSPVSQNENATQAFNRGINFYDQRNYDEALKEFTQTIQYDPKFALAYNGRGMVYYKKNDVEMAIADFSQAIELNPNDAKFYNNRGNVYSADSNYDTAIADFDTAIQLNPKYMFAYNSRGWAFYNKSEYNKAISDFNQAIELDPKYALAYNNRGMTYEALGKYELATADYNQAIQLDEKFSYPYHNRGNVYKAKGEYDLAISDFNQAISINPNYIIAFIARSSVYIAQGQYSLAIKDLEFAKQLNRDVKILEQINKLFLSIPEDYSKVNNPYNLSLKSIQRKDGLVSAEFCFNLPSDSQWNLETFDYSSVAGSQVVMITDKDTFEVIAWNDSQENKLPKKGELKCETVEFQPPDSVDLSGSKIIVNKLVIPIPEKPDCKKVQEKIDQLHPGFVVYCEISGNGSTIGLTIGPNDISQGQAYTFLDDALHEAVAYGPWIFSTGLSKK